MSIAAPAKLYSRVVKMRHMQQRNLRVHRRHSFSEDARVDKSVSKVDLELQEQFGEYKQVGVGVGACVCGRVHVCVCMWVCVCVGVRV